MEYKVNKQKCVGCMNCVQVCPEGVQMAKDGKAEVIDSEKVEKCGGENICPFGAIDKIEEEKKKK
jgi:ferredoxin